MRIALAAAMTAGCLAAAPPAGAEPATNCPPSCNRIPFSAWISPASIPMADGYDWPALAALAVPVRPVRFRFEELCATPARADDPRAFAVAERASVTSPDGQWELQSQIVHWRGESWWAGQLAADSVSAATADLRACQRSNPGASPSVTLSQTGRLAAVISGPVVLHQYLLADPVSGTVTELALWKRGPQAPSRVPDVAYPTVSDEAVLDALGAPLCTAYIGSCP